MNGNRMHDILETLSRRGVPENINLWPNISARIEGKSPMMALRTRPLKAILITLLALLVLSSVAYALVRMLGFIPAPEGMALPVNTVQPTESIIPPVTEATIASNLTLPAVDLAHGIALSADSFVPMDDGYLLIGSMQCSLNEFPAYGVKPIPFTGYVTIVDATGQDVSWGEVYGNVKPQNEEYRSYWAIKALSRSFAPPLTITFNAADVQIQPIAFRFDIGLAPQAGQSWEILHDLQVAGSFIHLEKANLISAEGSLDFQLDAEVDANIIGGLRINTALNQCMGGGGGYVTPPSA